MVPPSHRALALLAVAPPGEAGLPPELEFGIARLTLIAALVLAVQASAAAPASQPGFFWAAQPVWSPDGRRIAFVFTPGQHRLGVMSAADGSGKRQLAVREDAGYDQIEWAPSRRIVTLNDGELAAVDPRTGKAADLGGGNLFSVSRDGRRLAFASSCSHCQSSIRVVRPLPVPANASDSDPDFSPDGSRVVFVRLHYRAGQDPVGPPRLFVEPVAGGPARSLAVEGQFPRWSPDGRWIAFFSSSERSALGQYQLRLEIVRAAGGRPRVLATVPELTTFAWSPDSTRLGYATSGRKVAVVDLRGRSRLLGSARYGEYPLRWSPDGTEIAFSGIVKTYATGSYIFRMGIFVVDVDGRGQRRLA